MESSLVVRVIAGIGLILIVVVPLVLWDQAKRADGRLKTNDPSLLPFKWGYLYGMAALWFGVIASIGLLGALLPSPPYMPERPPDASALVSLVVWSMPLTISGFFVLRRKRWAWVLATLLSLNPVIWLINLVYGARRWREMGPRLVVQADSGLQIKSAPRHESTEKGGQAWRSQHEC